MISSAFSSKHVSKHPKSALKALEEESSDESESACKKSRPALQDIADHSRRSNTPAKSRRELFQGPLRDDAFEEQVVEGGSRQTSTSQEIDDMENFYPPREKESRRHSVVSYKEPSLGGKLRQVSLGASFATSNSFWLQGDPHTFNSGYDTGIKTRTLDESRLLSMKKRKHDRLSLHKSK